MVLDKVLGNIVYGDEEAEDTQLIESQSEGEINVLDNSNMQTHIYREIRKIQRE